MRATRFSVTFLAALAAAAGARAEATKQGADALLQQFSSYFGPFLADQGLLAVDPKGDGYAVSFDVEKAFGLLKLPGADFKMDRLVYIVEQKPDGGWSARSAHAPGAVFRVPTPKGDVSGKVGVSGYSFEAVYDPKLREIFRSATRVAQLDAKIHVPDSAGPRGDVDIYQSGLAIDAKATALEGGAVTAAFSQTIKSTEQSVVIDQATGKGGPVRITYIFGPIAADGEVKALRWSALRELVMWLLANKDSDKTAAFQFEAKARLLTVLPLWDSFDARFLAQDVALEAPQGALAMKALSESVTISGLGATSQAGLAFGFKDLNVKSALMPGWARQLLPASFDFDIKASVAGLDLAAKTALDDQELGSKAPMSKATEAKIAAIMMGGTHKVVLAPGRLTIPLIDVSYEGEVAIAQARPAGHFVITADSFDKVMAFLQDKTTGLPNPQNAMLAVTFAKGLAKTDAAGKLVWTVDFTDNRKVTVNGQEFPLGK